MYEIIDGKGIADNIKLKIKDEISLLNLKVGLAVILIGNNPASEVYVNIKKKTCKELGIDSYEFNLDENILEEELIKLIKELNNDEKINGILIQLPLPIHINKNNILLNIDPIKDVDGFSPVNIGKLLIGEDCLEPCTPKGIIRLLIESKIDLEGKDIVVIGKSMIVGTPVANMLLNKNATVTVCHSKTKNLKEKCLNADIIVSAVGKHKLITKDMVKENVIIIDVGVNKIDNKLYGDVDFENVKNKCSFITPVPGGVGPMTIACLMENTLKAYKIQRGL
jgi:methylenetetrahydrofolate dehydrogenase (NADP+) / methenyltetrahydrofolate cyclohydrolase